MIISINRSGADRAAADHGRVPRALRARHRARAGAHQHGGILSAAPSGSDLPPEMESLLTSFGDKDPVLHAGGCMLAITAMSEAEQKASWEFMKFLLSADNIARWTKDTGYVPARNDVADNQLKDYLAENQLMWAAMDQIPYMEAWPYYSGDTGLEGDVYMNDVRDRILGGEDAAKVLVEAQDHINKMVN